MSPIENPSDDDWDLIGSPSATKYEKLQSRRGSENRTKTISKMGDVANERGNVNNQCESATIG
jgi:hypothetical protein